MSAGDIPRCPFCGQYQFISDCNPRGVCNCLGARMDRMEYPHELFTPQAPQYGPRHTITHEEYVKEGGREYHTQWSKHDLTPSWEWAVNEIRDDGLRAGFWCGRGATSEIEAMTKIREVITKDQKESEYDDE
jgi:hypothetical protein